MNVQNRILPVCLLMITWREIHIDVADITELRGLNAFQTFDDRMGTQLIINRLSSPDSTAS